MLALLIPGLLMGSSGSAPVVVVTDQPSGGWLFLHTYESELKRRRKELKERQEREEESEQIQDAVDREIALLLRRQEAIDDKRKEFERLAELAKKDANIEAARQYSERVATAFARAVAQENYSALAALDRELKRAMEEEEVLLLSMMMEQT